MPATTRKPAARSTMSPKNARRIVRSYLRAAVAFHSVVPSGKAKAAPEVVESLRSTVDRLDEQLDRALRALPKR